MQISQNLFCLWNYRVRVRERDRYIVSVRERERERERKEEEDRQIDREGGSMHEKPPCHYKIIKDWRKCKRETIGKSSTSSCIKDKNRSKDLHTLNIFYIY